MNGSEQLNSRWWRPLFYSLLLIAGGCVGYFLRSPEQRKFYEVLDLVQRDYADSVNAGQLEENGIAGMLKKLDPHSVYLPPVSAKMAGDQLSGHFEGIGIEYFTEDDSLFITGVMKGGPAESAGVLPRDILLRAGSSRISGASFKFRDLSSVIKGEAGTTVHLVLYRASERKTVELDVKRARLGTQSVHRVCMARPGVGYLFLDIFNSNTYSEFMEAARSLKKQGAKELIIDLRDNGGGYMDQAESILNEFFPAGDTLVETRGRSRRTDTYVSDGKGTLQDMKLKILVNGNTASASEVMAGCFQDMDRADIIGTRTFGKGLVQEAYNLSDGSTVRLTIARYYTPSGRSIQKPYHDYSYWTDTSGSSVAVKPFRTRKGRTVFSGGGITPDVTVVRDSLPDALEFIISRRLDDRFVFHLDLREIRKKYSSAKSFVEQFQIPSSWFYSLSALGNAGIPFAQNEAKALDLRLRETISGMLWGEEGEIQWMLRYDPFLAKALNAN